MGCQSSPSSSTLEQMCVAHLTKILGAGEEEARVLLRDLRQEYPDLSPGDLLDAITKTTGSFVAGFVNGDAKSTGTQRIGPQRTGLRGRSVSNTNQAIDFEPKVHGISEVSFRDNTQKLKAHQMFNKLSKKYCKEVLSGDYMFDGLLAGITSSIMALQEEDIISTQVTTTVNRKAGRKLESILFKMLDLKELFDPKITVSTRDSRFSFITDKDARINFSIIYLETERFVELVRQVSRIINRYVVKVEGSSAELLDNLIAFHDPDSALSIERSSNSSAPALVQALMIYILIHVNKYKLVTVGNKALKLDPGPLRRIHEEHVRSFKEIDYNSISNSYIQLGRDMLTWVNSTSKLLYACRQVFTNETAKLINYPVRYVFGVHDMHDGYDNLIPELAERLKKRPTLLPTNGIQYTVHMEMKEGEEGGVPSYIEGLATFYINEIITQGNKLYTVFRVERQDEIDGSYYNHLYILNPNAGSTETLLLYANIFPNMQKSDVIMDTCTLYAALCIYEKSLLYYAGCDHTLVEDKMFKVSNIKQGPSLFDETIYIPGFIRRLPEGQVASQDARDNAIKIGLSLKDNETYVRPFHRTAPKARCEYAQPKYQDLNDVMGDVF